jgi:hypothetical protein
MDNKNYARFTAVIFTIIAVLHGLRLVLGWEAVIGGFVVPMWLSAVAVLIAGCLAYYGYKLAK